jgi:hypothetical protein
MSLYGTIGMLTEPLMTLMLIVILVRVSLERGVLERFHYDALLDSSSPIYCVCLGSFSHIIELM